MKQNKVKLTVFSLLIIFIVLSGLSSHLMAGSDPFEVLIKVDEHGFYDSEGKAIHEPLEVPKERNIKLIFEHIGKPGVEHEFVLLFDSDEEISSGKISDSNKRTYIAFTSGEEEESYNVFCVIVDCDGMEHLTDLVLIAT